MEKENAMRNSILSICACAAMSLSSTASAINTVSFGAVEFDGTYGSVEIMWNSSLETLAGLQFVLEGVTITNAEGGLTENLDWTVFTSESMVIAFPISTNFIEPPLDPVNLIVVDFEATDASVLSFGEVVCSNENAESIEIDASDSVVLDSCPTDLNGDNTTNVNDLLLVIGGWGNPYNVDDLLGIIQAWGAC
jgi:hypothetical protein